MINFKYYLVFILTFTLVILPIFNDAQASTCKNFSSDEECNKHISSYEMKNVAIKNVAETSVDISWETSISVIIMPDYYYIGPNNVPIGTAYIEDRVAKTIHIMNLKNLRPGTNYYIKFQPYDPAIDSHYGIEYISFKTRGIDPNLLDYYRSSTDTTIAENRYQFSAEQTEFIADHVESVTVDFVKNGSDNPINTKYLYAGEVEVAVAGTGQANGRIESDTYYYSSGELAESDGRFYGLYIDGKKITDVFYRSFYPDHFYEFKIDVGETPRAITFNIGDDQLWDNSGFLTVWLKGSHKAPLQQTEESITVEREIVKQNRAISNIEQDTINTEKQLVKNISASLLQKVKGRILLQVESKGEAWYVDPVSKNKFYLANGAVALQIMKALGLGVTNRDLDSIPIGYKQGLYQSQDNDSDGIPDTMETALGSNPLQINSHYNSAFDDMLRLLNGERLDKKDYRYVYDQDVINRLKGRILLQVESKGEAWYVNPVDSRRYFLGDPETAYNVMRYLSLGIRNDNLRQIQVGEIKEE